MSHRGNDRYDRRGDDYKRSSGTEDAKRRRVDSRGNQPKELSAADQDAKDDIFFRKQDLLAIQIRLKEGRSKPIDKLFKLIHRDEEYPIHQNAYRLIKALNAKETTELQEAIPKYRDLLPGGGDLWTAVSALLAHRIIKLTSQASKEDEDVSKDIKAIFEDKTYSELEEMEKQIEDNLNGEEAAINPEYWDTVLKKLRIRKAKVKLEKVGQETVVKTEHKYEEDEIVYEDDQPPQPAAYVDPRRAALEKEAARLRAKAQASGKDDKKLSEEELLKREASIPMEKDEELFQGEVKLTKTYDEPRRKPKFYNRVETGYDWNRYNQTHYDDDNPPPKIVIGYKFNIFYPDLPANAKTPTYKLLPADSPDYVNLTFIAGAPYEDVAFSVVRKEWEHSHKKGFKCNFERGILHLWFDFKKYRYRR